ncbi:MAG: LacI family transcriptional regulator [Verrucomicrobia bacterium]|nr:LacI family transcriptional regulator [Verrucomicrobiota bacterium]MBU4247049.1 LacI family transcriptional regulator [Verrucomicrobiota bacterium]MBU4291123.1 LacI family transcriptional regulator [Verrucomicrobiota bacterium]MBU4498160.1 LacI family transcriptional regulator [Verrucomicrobiota bacterium]MCG2680140.1 LacI family transcriptional regulator [Kiritimatiellia bacterium]
MATLKDIARKTGFSVAVVSRALNPRPDRYARVSPVTRRLLMQVAREIGFRRNRMAEFMRRGGLPTVGVFLPAAANRLVADLVFGISEILSEEDLPLQIGFDSYVEGFRKFLRRNVDLAHSGIISYPGLIADPDVEKEVAAYRFKGGKVVLLNTSAQLDGVPVISIDDRHGGRLAAERLLARRCVRFAFMGSYSGRKQGFQQFLSAAGRTAREFKSDASGLKSLSRFCLKASSSRPVGIFAATDVLALRVLRALSLTSLQVGRDVLLIGYDDLDLTSEITPALTTLHQPFREEGRLAARKLICMINGGQESSVLIPPRLVIRESA